MKALRIHVERAVRPLCASPLRKDRMREELLGHLSTIYAQECERLGEGPEALTRAQERFGDPAELSKALQEAVPWWERVSYSRWKSVLDSCFVERKPGESPLRYVVRQNSPFFFGTLVAVSVVAFVPDWNVNWTTGFSFVFAVFFLCSLNALLFPMLFRSLHKALAGHSYARAAGWGCLCSLLVAFSGHALHGWANWCAAATPFVAEDINRILTFALLTPFILALVPRILAEKIERRKNRQEWENLELDAG